LKNSIKLIIVSLSTFIFSTPVCAQDYEHTINYMLFQGYKEYGINVSVTTNFDTDEGATLYLAVYSDEGFLTEAVSKPLEQIFEDERHVYRLKISSVLDETMTVKAFIWKNMVPCALPISKKYDEKSDSVTITVDPETKEYIYNSPDDIINADDIKDKILDNNISDINPGVVTYPVTDSTGEIDVSTNGDIVGESYYGIYSEKTPVGNINISLDEYGNLIYNSN